MKSIYPWVGHGAAGQWVHGGPLYNSLYSVNALFSLIKCFFKRETFECGRLSDANMLTLTSNSINVKEDTFWPTEIATILF